MNPIEHKRLPESIESIVRGLVNNLGEDKTKMMMEALDLSSAPHLFLTINKVTGALICHHLGISANDLWNSACRKPGIQVARHMLYFILHYTGELSFEAIARMWTTHKKTVSISVQSFSQELDNVRDGMETEFQLHHHMDTYRSIDTIISVIVAIYRETAADQSKYPSAWMRVMKQGDPVTHNRVIEQVSDFTYYFTTQSSRYGRSPQPYGG